jgi:hypothetical protein
VARAEEIKIDCLIKHLVNSNKNHSEYKKLRRRAEKIPPIKKREIETDFVNLLNKLENLLVA